MKPNEDEKVKKLIELIELIKIEKFTGKKIFEFNFSQGKLARFYSLDRKEIKTN